MEINFSLLHLNQDSIAFISTKIDHTHIYTAVLFINISFCYTAEYLSLTYLLNMS